MVGVCHFFERNPVRDDGFGIEPVPPRYVRSAGKGSSDFSPVIVCMALPNASDHTASMYTSAPNQPVSLFRNSTTSSIDLSAGNVEGHQHRIARLQSVHGRPHFFNDTDKFVSESGTNAGVGNKAVI